MSKAQFERVAGVVRVLDALGVMEELLGEKPTVVLSDEAKSTWDALVTCMEKFYAMPVEERWRFAEMSEEDLVE